MRTIARWAIAVTCLVGFVAGPNAAHAAGPAGPPAKPIRLAVPAVAKGGGSSFDRGTVLVRFRPGSSPSARSAAVERLGLTLGAPVGRTRFVVVGLNGHAARRAVSSLQADPAVAEAQLNFLRHADVSPNDPFYGPYQKKYLENGRFPDAWDVTKGSTGTSVAILDTGVDLTHPDLDGQRLKAGYDFVNDDADPQDDNGHGTFVAGVAAAITNNEEGVAGAAWKGGIIPVKVLDDQGIGTDAEIASGLTWATDNGAKVINLSLGGPDVSQVLGDAVNYALAADVVVIASAGNDGNSTPSYPAAYEGVVAVSATDRSGNFAYFSNYGWWVDMSAPGMFITSTFWFGGEHSYATGFGTSFSAPLVAGAAILVRVHEPTWTQAEVVDQLLATAQDRGPAGVDPFFGRGWLDAYAALGGGKQAAADVPEQDSLEPDGVVHRANKLVVSTSKPTISPEGDEDWFKKTVDDPGSITFTVTPPAPDPEGDRTLEFDPVLEVYGPDYRLLGTMDQNYYGQAETIAVPAATAGTYYLRVRNYLGSRSSDTYAVDVSTSTSYLPLTFTDSEAHDVGGNPQSTLIADVTGDGRADLLATTQGSFDPKATLFLFAQNQDGTLADPVPFATGEEESAGDMDLAAGDLDGDGFKDVAVATDGPTDPTGVIAIFYQSGGTLTGPTNVSTTYDAQEVEVADLEGDGDQDLVTQTAGGLEVLTQDAGVFTESAPIGTANHTDIAVDDVSGDGLPDIVALCDPSSTCSSPDAIEVFVQQPELTFTATTYALSDAGHGVAVADVNGDGVSEVVATVGGAGAGGLDVFTQDGTGGLTGPVTTPSADTPIPIEALDMNGDGRLDLVVGHDGLSELGVYLQGSDGTLGDEHLVSVPYGNYDPTSLSLGDLNGDGVADIAVADTAVVQVVRQVPSVTGPSLWIQNTSPTDFGTDVARDKDVTVTFQRDLDPASVTTDTAYVMNAGGWTRVTVTVTYDPVTKKITLDKATNYKKRKPYVVFIDGVKDLNGNVMPLFSFRFKTGST
jgi:subtilisin family serine protease